MRSVYVGVTEEHKKDSPLRGLRVKVHYKGSGTVDEKHKILVFLFDSPEFGHSNGNAVCR